ncbi:recombinase family protein [Plantactinospora sp. CA-290183]|uniref:recombinase family protein n=1 Tax=Plantactinospora sp. CA-290183 TaxID=3240006 RepID=UPI003D8B5A77
MEAGSGPRGGPGAADRAGDPDRVARTSTARQELASQLDALRRAECHKIFQEQISTRVKVRPELEKALALAHQFKEAAPETPVIVTVHELKRLARNAAELMTLSADLQAGGIQLELLTGPLTGIYDPNGMGAMFFAVLAVAGQIERNYIREKTLEGQVLAAAKGNHGGRPKVIDDDSLIFALALKDKGVPVPNIAKKLTIKTGKNAGSPPSVASLYRAFAEAEQAAADDGSPLRPTPARIRHPDDPETPGEVALRERLQGQVFQRSKGEQADKVSHSARARRLIAHRSSAARSASTSHDQLMAGVALTLAVPLSRSRYCPFGPYLGCTRSTSPNWLIVRLAG